MALLIKQELEQFCEKLHEIYPDPKCELAWENPWQLMMAIILSAQSTDKNVNRVTPELFKAVPTPEKAIELGVEGPYTSWWHMFGWNVFGVLFFGPMIATQRFFDTLNKTETELNRRNDTA